MYKIIDEFSGCIYKLILLLIVRWTTVRGPIRRVLRDFRPKIVFIIYLGCERFSANRSRPQKLTLHGRQHFSKMTSVLVLENFVEKTFRRLKIFIHETYALRLGTYVIVYNF